MTWIMSEILGHIEMHMSHWIPGIFSLFFDNNFFLDVVLNNIVEDLPFL